MQNLQTSIAVIVGLLIRLGIPIGVTVVFVWLLSRLDRRWEEGARISPGKQVTSIIRARNPGCWEINKCTVENRKNCTAYLHPETPCWQVFRNSDGRLKPACIGCKVFLEAPIPA
jgi:hypothetical protein